MGSGGRTRVEQLFLDALELHGTERVAFLQHACGTDKELLTAVEKMLAENEHIGDFLQEPVISIETEQVNELARGRQFDLAGQTPRPSLFATGTIIAERFTVVRFIASGGMGEVYEVSDRLLHDSHVAMKTILPAIAGNPHTRRRFENEVLAARQITHPNVCPIYDIYHSEGPRGNFSFLTMKLLKGETLADRLRREGPLRGEEPALIIRQITAALMAAHKAQVIHRDIKPRNIILDGNGGESHVWVTDFGVAYQREVDATLSNSVGVPGTPGYIAPELLAGAAPSFQTDVYSLGVVIHEILTGGRPTESGALASSLQAPWKELVNGCLAPNPQKRFKDVGSVLTLLDRDKNIVFLGTPNRGRAWDRRQILRLGGGAAAAGLGAGLWLERARIPEILNPLPEKRFVALMAWPASAGEVAKVLPPILDAIGNELARAEAYTKNLLVVSLKDIGGSKATTAKQPGDVISSLGANLVLAGTLTPQKTDFFFRLQLLDAATLRVLRQRHVICGASALSSLTERGWLLAADLLGIPVQAKALSDQEELASLPLETFSRFSQAETLLDQPNRAGVDGAIEQYQKALDNSPHFALGYAKLARAYIFRYQQLGDGGALRLAAENVALALKHNPVSTQGRLSRALLYVYQGKTAEAFDELRKALQADPSSPEILLYKARVLRDLDRWTEEEAVYREIVSKRPNYWPGYNELGLVLVRQGKYGEASEVFETAAAAAPRVALPLTNLGMTYLQMGRRKDAIDACLRSLRRAPNAFALLNLGDLSFEDKDYAKALDYYTKASDLEPNNHLCWRNIADCHAMLGNARLVLDNYQKAAAVLSARLETNPTRGAAWMTLAFYHAKLRDRQKAEADLKQAQVRGATDLESQFTKAQALVLLGRGKEALSIVISCIDKGLSPAEVDLALDLKDIRSDPAYRRHLNLASARKKLAQQ